MGHRQRFVVEAEWSGYTSAQRHVVHRTVETLFRRGWDNMPLHVFGDGTSLHVTIRDAKPREKVKEIHGYTAMLRDAAWKAWERTKPPAPLSTPEQK